MRAALALLTIPVAILAGITGVVIGTATHSGAMVFGALLHKIS